MPAFAARPRREPALPPGDTTAGHQLVNITAPLVAWSRDRRRVYVNSSDGGAATLIDVESGATVPCQTPAGESHGSFVNKADPDRQAMFGTDADGALVRYDLLTATVTHTSPVPRPLELGAFALSGDGHVLAVETERLDPDGDLLSHDVTIRHAATLAVLKRLPALAHWALGMWLNAEGSLLVATADQDERVELWDTRSGQRRWSVGIGYRAGLAIAQPPDGRRLLIGTFDGGVVLLDLANGRVLARHTLPLSAQIWSADFAPNGGVVALGGNDGQVHLLTGDTLREIGKLPIGTGASWALAAYSSDGSVLSAVDERGRVVRWDTRPESWLRRACAVVARDLTPAEWDTYLPGVPHRSTCTAG
jgi:WD40 repeat protein